MPYRSKAAAVEPAPPKIAGRPGKRPTVSPAARPGAVTAARQDREQLAEMMGSAIEAIVSVDQEQRIVLLNAAAERMFGWSAAGVMGKPLDFLIPGSVRLPRRGSSPLFDGMGSMNRKRGQPCVLSGLRADGTAFPVEITVSQVTLQGRTVYTTLLRDVTERVQAEQRFRKSEEELEEFFATAPLGLMWVDAGGRVVRVNEVELELLDRPIEEVMGHSVTKLHVDEASVVAVLQRVAEHQTVRNYHLSVQTKESGIRHLLVDANGQWENGRLLHSRWFVRDITHRVKLECEILAIAEQERGRIGRELHDDLCQQLVATEYLNETLVNAWTAVAPAAALKAREVSAQLRKSIEYARELARGLTPSLDVEPNDLAFALQELAERTQRIFQRACRFECITPIAVRDRTVSVHLYRIAQEAVGNAIKHARASRIDIHLGASKRDLILGVEDNGIGLPEELPKEKGVGLRIIQYRVGAIGGSLAIQRISSGGTAVVCTVKDALVPASDSHP